MLTMGAGRGGDLSLRYHMLLIYCVFKCLGIYSRLKKKKGKF